MGSLCSDFYVWLDGLSAGHPWLDDFKWIALGAVRHLTFDINSLMTIAVAGEIKFPGACAVNVRDMSEPFLGHGQPPDKLPDKTLCYVQVP